MKIQKKYKVILNWYGENHIFYTTSYSQKSALSNASRRLATKLGVLHHYCRIQFSTKSNYQITEV